MCTPCKLISIHCSTAYDPTKPLDETEVIEFHKYKLLQFLTVRYSALRFDV